jgi:maltose O-acetyltransferase
MIGLIQRIRRKRYIAHLVQMGLKLGDNVTLNDAFFLDPSHCFLITLEDGVTFGPGVRVFAHDASSFSSLGRTRIGLVTLKEGCFIGASSVILPGVTVGAHSIVGANSTVTRSIPANEVWAGSPAKRLMSLADYANLHDLRQARVFSESEYGIERITEARKAEMIATLERDRFAYLAP